MSIGSAVLSIVTGGASGLIGTIVSGVFGVVAKGQEIKANQQKFDQAVKLKTLDIQIMDKEWAYRTQNAKIEAEKEVEVEDSKAFKESVWHEPDRYSNPDKITPVGEMMMEMLDFLKGMIRPAMTLYLCAITTMVYFEAKYALQISDVVAGRAFDIYELIVSTILYLTTTVVMWWFGSRLQAGKLTIFKGK